MVAGLDDVRALGTGHQVPGHLALIAEALGAAGQPAEALARLDDALAQVERTGERIHEAELHRLRGEILLARRGSRSAPGAARASEAEGCFRQAIERARRQGATLWELRATVSLHRLRRSGEGRVALAALCGRFRDGTRLADLDDARALLAEG